MENKAAMKSLTKIGIVLQLASLLLGMQLSTCAHSQIPIIDIKNMPAFWVLSELNKQNIDFKDVNLVDITFPCKIVYQTKDGLAHLYTIQPTAEEMSKGSLCENPANLMPDSKLQNWAGSELKKITTDTAKIIDITYPCKVVYSLDKDSIPRVLNVMDAQSEQCKDKPIPLSAAEEKRQKEIQTHIEQVRSNNTRNALSTQVLVLAFVVISILFMFVIRPWKSQRDSDTN